MRSLLRPLLPLLGGLAFGCGNGLPPIDTDAGCGAPGVPADQPSIGCPSELDLGCVPATGAALSYAVSTATCDGSPVTLSCDPPSGTVVLPPTSGGTTAYATCTATGPSGASASCRIPLRMRVQGAPQLICPPDLTQACSGPRTPITAPPAIAVESCDGAGALTPPTSDAPAEGFAVGSARVTYTSMTPGGAAVTCSSAVVITDTVAPTITCPVGPQTVVRSAPSDVILNFSPPATDACDDRLTVSVTPMPMGRGDTAVVATTTDDAGNTASCNATLRIIDVFAVENLRVISASMGASATDVTLAWDPSLGLDVEELGIERASAVAGPYTELMRVPTSTLTFTDAGMPGERGFYRVVSYGPSGTRGGITPSVRALAIAADQYAIEAQPVPGVPFATTLYGVIRHPLDLTAGPYPLVVLLHGNHGNCRPATGDDECEERTVHACTDGRFTTTPNAEGYVYLQETLAAQGYVSVSLSANALNCRDDFIPERTALILEHLRRWAARTLGLDGALMSATDLTRTSLVGHSRGGEAVSQAPQALEATPIAGVSLASVLAIGPTDYHDNTPTGVPYLALLPSCDADVRTLEGAQMVDRGAAELDGEMRGHVLFVGANHNFFHTEWRFDDNAPGFSVCAAADRLDGAAMRAGLEDLLGSWLRATAPAMGAASPIDPWFRGEARSPVSLDAWADRGLDLRFSYFAASRAVIDDFTGSLDAGTLGPVAYTGYTAAVACSGTCSDNFVHVASGARLAWDTAAATASFSASGLDASSYRAISVRFASRAATINAGIEEHDFSIRVTDGRGTSASVPVSEVGRVPAVYPAFRPLEVLGTVRVPFARLRAVSPTLDLSALARVEVVMPISGSPTGSIWIADVEVTGE